MGESIKVFGRENKGQTLQIGNVPEKEKDQIYVRFAPRGSVYTLPKKLQEILNTKPADLRDNHLVRIDTNILDRITNVSVDANQMVVAQVRRLRSEEHTSELQSPMYLVCRLLL